jgi:hypothetical protein
MRKVVTGYFPRNRNLEPMLIEMCSRIAVAMNGKPRKGDALVTIRLVVEGKHRQAEKPKGAA